MGYIVYDKRNMKVLFRSKNPNFCESFVGQYLSLFEEDMGYILIRSVED